MAIQEPTLTYTNPQTKKEFTREEFIAFARDYLGRGRDFLERLEPLAERGR